MADFHFFGITSFLQISMNAPLRANNEIMFFEL